VEIGVLEEDYSSESASFMPSFAITKKYGSATIRVVTDVRKLNSLLKRHPFPIPTIGEADMIRSIEGGLS
jgi:hypothetical protein